MDVALKDLPIEQLLSYKDSLIKLKESYEHIMNSIYIAANDEDNSLCKSMTIATFAVLKKIAEGKKIKEFNNDDFKDIAKILDQYMTMENDQYTLFIFTMYERYISTSFQQVYDYASSQQREALQAIIDDLAAKNDLFENHQINEVNYIEDCMWLCLEAMIKLISVSVSHFMSTDSADFINAYSTFAFEYGRYMLYKKENDILNEYIESQHVLDQELEYKYNQFIEELDKQSSYFYTLIDNAFAEDFKTRFLSSIQLAKESGVDDSEILHDIEDIDSFFE